MSPVATPQLLVAAAVGSRQVAAAAVADAAAAAAVREREASGAQEGEAIASLERVRQVPQKSPAQC
jgi:hypothetical protein